MRTPGNMGHIPARPKTDVELLVDRVKKRENDAKEKVKRLTDELRQAKSELHMCECAARIISQER